MTAARLPEFRREVERREATLQALSRILPSNKEVDDLLRKVQQMAAESSLNVLRFKPEATQPREFYAAWPISLELDGNYHNLAYFFDRLEQAVSNREREQLEGQLEQETDDIFHDSCNMYRHNLCLYRDSRTCAGQGWSQRQKRQGQSAAAEAAIDLIGVSL